jgi:hypothetical protein
MIDATSDTGHRAGHRAGHGANSIARVQSTTRVRYLYHLRPSILLADSEVVRW